MHLLVAPKWARNVLKSIHHTIDYEIRSAIRFLTARNMTAVVIQHQICEVYGHNAKSAHILLFKHNFSSDLLGGSYSSIHNTVQTRPCATCLSPLLIHEIIYLRPEIQQWSISGNGGYNVAIPTGGSILREMENILVRYNKCPKRHESYVEKLIQARRIL